MAGLDAMAGRRVGVFFGGVSPEHEVSIISALQAMAALEGTDWQAVPVYIGKDGRWWAGPALRDVATFKRPLTGSAHVYPVTILPQPGRGLVLRPAGERTLLQRLQGPPTDVSVDVVLPVMHGGAGENGSLQGLCETLGVAYAGSGPMAAALAMDKVAAKRWAATFDIPQVPFSAFTEREWAGREESLLDTLERQLGLPVIVKPARLGSSIGIGRADTRKALDAAIEEAFRYDDLVVVERAVTRLRELNCSVLGQAGDATASVLEEPLSGKELLSFKDKYLRGGGSAKGGGPGTPPAVGSAAGGTPPALGPATGGTPPAVGSATGGTPPASDSAVGTTARRGPKQRAAGMASLDRRIPAPVPDQMTAHVQALAVRVFEAFGCSGLVRIDFLLDQETGEVYFNEINTMPGSLSFYLWEPSGVPFPELLDRVLRLGVERFRAAAGRVRTYDVNLLSERDLGGLKGSKS